LPAYATVLLGVFSLLNQLIMKTVVYSMKGANIP
jgi:hypothetical protein